jgi:hypothetical protein
MTITLIILCLFIILLLLTFYFILSITSSPVPIVNFPFKNFYTDSHVRIPVVAITAPFRNKHDYDTFLLLKKKGITIIGMTCYMEFPLLLSNPHDPGYSYPDIPHIDNMFYLHECQAWLSCFRHSLPVSTPQIQISHSDFIDPYPISSTVKHYDFLYVCLPDNDTCDGWQSFTRNWTFAKQCIEYLTCHKNLTGLLVGRIHCKSQFSKQCQKKLHTTDRLSFHDFQNYMTLCRWLFVPNILDASPRVIPEALSKNIPVFVNSHILGGWKYVHPLYTGRFFSSFDDFKSQLDIFLSDFTIYTPNRFFTMYYGKKNTGYRLYDFLVRHGLFPYHEHVSYIYPDV